MNNILIGLMDEIKRNEELLKIYESIPTGGFGAAVLEVKIKRAKKSIESGDLVEMIASYKDLQKSE